MQNNRASYTGLRLEMTKHPTDQPVNQTVNQTANQTVNQTANQIIGIDLVW